MKRNEYEKLRNAYEELELAYDFARYVCDDLKEDNDFIRRLCYTNGIEVPQEPCGYEYLPTEEFLYEQRRYTAIDKGWLQRIFIRSNKKGRRHMAADMEGCGKPSHAREL
jgi:hypothetical protein